MSHSRHVYEGANFSYLYSNNSRAAVYHSDPEYVRRRFDFALPADYIIRALENEDLDSTRFTKHFVPKFLPHPMDTSTSAYFQSLISFAYADQIYAHLPQAEVSLAVFSKTLCEYNRAQSLLRGSYHDLSRTVSLACASLFHTGYLDLQIGDLEDVLAVSSGNSIYASEFLFRDPSFEAPSPPCHWQRWQARTGFTAIPTRHCLA